MRTLLTLTLAAGLLAGMAGCTVNTYGNGQREIEPGVSQQGPTSNPADASRGQNGSGALP
ncbi:hypothetical protein [Salinicola aestuarinus]|uniref:hypothetical protein n=1 Tax=Salinicola aestuarinus TaxID=1949082 RepID=UPI000DA19559|nr:hypothetical protein [Salinicola aestuarinus]